MSGRMKRACGFFLFILVGYVVGRAIFRQWTQIDWSTLRMDVKFLTLALILEITARTFLGILYGGILSRLGCGLALHIPVAVCWISMLGRYIPGKVALMGSAIYLFSSYKVRPVAIDLIPMVVSITALSGALGLFAFFSPAGLGVREGVYLFALSPIVGVEMAALCAVLLRALQTACDGVCGAAGLLIFRGTRGRSCDPDPSRTFF